MDVADFDFELPESAIAQEPVAPRDASRLLVAGRSGAPTHRAFSDLPDLLNPDDLVVVNDTRVLPARVEARRPSGGRVGLLLLDPAGGDDWWCLLKASRKPVEGERLDAGEGLEIEVRGRDAERFRVRLRAPDGRPLERLERIGRMPLPPYIRRVEGDPRDGSDRDRYQTVYARAPGAVAAPTAGLHFTPGLLDRLASRGVRVAPLTLHVGLGTFRPVRSGRVEDHEMHAERFDVPEATASAIAETRRRNGRVVAVGTTVVRTLEDRATGAGQVEPGAGTCALFITPGYRFRVVDAVVTNFHLPRSTLLMLVSAFAGRERVLDLYRVALDAGYRFYSYGDAMFLTERT